MAAIQNWNNKKHGVSVTGIWQETDQELLFTSEKGLFRLTQTAGTFEIEPIIVDSTLFRSADKLLRQKNTRFVWVATQNGILVINTVQKKLEKHIKSETIKHNLLSNIVHCLSQDKEKI